MNPSVRTYVPKAYIGPLGDSSIHLSKINHVISEYNLNLNMRVSLLPNINFPDKKIMGICLKFKNTAIIVIVLGQFL